MLESGSTASTIYPVDDVMRNILGHSPSDTTHYVLWNVKQCNFLIKTARSKVYFLLYDALEF